MVADSCKNCLLRVTIKDGEHLYCGTFMMGGFNGGVCNMHKPYPELRIGRRCHTAGEALPAPVMYDETECAECGLRLICRRLK